MFLAEQQERERQLKQQRAPKSKDSSIQCSRESCVVPSETADVAVQTDLKDVMDDLKEQVKTLTKIVADLTSLSKTPKTGRWRDYSTAVGRAVL